jgi:hypothetical protein
MAEEVDLIIRGSERQQSDASGALDRRRQQPLMARAVAGNAARRHLATFGNERRYCAQVFVIDS